MTDANECNIEGCTSPPRPHRRYNALLYCKTHYNEMLTGDFLSEYENWLPSQSPSERLLYLMGRMLEERWELQFMSDFQSS